ncbi:uncharacterized protein LOC125677154 isoform X1 [Ostrea edulis]|uniref:uncharacterized protein LOC125677154 isoform X1 n=1 Tax=Ostrea edulis TaxID=37623 RepID=UPI0024AFB65C|nr:uncharacterized protein LOC125677154 isoform X1 [Ostrea edulis]XP_048771084.2 uncharacterized protein LOC125677154 isoform X1 [Ostrea edulis]XP_056014123.1 uncharacterized protein LOC125677154 isoform X1 [Ostrea edulis]XP_056014124.1 uncharacterized protein LOC125677154 isoform X1 [Ostrea edulis]
MDTSLEYLKSWVMWPLDLISRPIKQPIIGIVLGWAFMWILLHIGNTILMYLAIFIIVFLVSEKCGFITIHFEKLTRYLNIKRYVQDKTRNTIPSLLETIQGFLVTHWLFSIGFAVGLVAGITF